MHGKVLEMHELSAPRNAPRRLIIKLRSLRVGKIERRIGIQTELYVLFRLRIHRVAGVDIYSRSPKSYEMHE